MQTAQDSVPDSLKGLVSLLRCQIERQETELRRTRQKLERLLHAHTRQAPRLVIDNKATCGRRVVQTDHGADLVSDADMQL
jgi:hypothetical protein